MIKLKTDIWDSVEINHPGQTGTNSVTYNLTHNKGTDPDEIIMYVKYISSASDRWKRAQDFDTNWTTGSGWTYNYYSSYHPTTTDDTLSIKVYRIGSSNTEKIRFKLLWY